jgi:hypothetical protein
MAADCETWPTAKLKGLQSGTRVTRPSDGLTVSTTPRLRHFSTRTWKTVILRKNKNSGGQKIKNTENKGFLQSVILRESKNEEAGEKRFYANFANGRELKRQRVSSIALPCCHPNRIKPSSLGLRGTSYPR